MRGLGILLLIIGGANAQAEPKVVEMPSANVDRVVVRGGNTSRSSQLKLVQKPGTSLTVQAQAGAFPAVRLQGRELIVEASAGANIEVTGPSREAAIFWAEGEVNLNSWNAATVVVGLKILVRSKGGEGALKVSSPRGKVALQKHHGDAIIDGSELESSLEDCEGDVNIGTRQAKVEIKNHRGKVSYVSFMGSLSNKNQRGPLEFNSHLATLQIEGHEGAVRGVATDGAITASVKEPVDFRVLTREGRVTLTLLQGAGATVFAEAKDADILAPKSVRVNRDEELRVAQGEIPGSTKGFVSIKTEGALIRIKGE